MIKEVTMYQVICDGCGRTEDEHITSMQIETLNLAMFADWIIHDDKHYCPDCYDYDKDRGLIINPRKEW